MRKFPVLHRIHRSAALGIVAILAFLSHASAEQVLQEDFSSWPDMDSPGVSSDWEAIGTSAQYGRLPDEEGIGAPLPEPVESVGYAARYLVRRSMTVPSGTGKLIIEFRLRQGSYMAPLVMIGKITPDFIEGYAVALTGSAPSPSGDILSKLDFLELNGPAVKGLARGEEFAENRAAALFLSGGPNTPAPGIETREIPRGVWFHFRWEIETVTTGVQMKLFLEGESEPILKASGTVPLFGETPLDVGFSFSAIGSSSPGLSQLSIQAVPSPSKP